MLQKVLAESESRQINQAQKIQTYILKQTRSGIVIYNEYFYKIYIVHSIRETFHRVKVIKIF